MKKKAIHGKSFDTRDEVMEEYQRIRLHILDDIQCGYNPDWWIENGDEDDVQVWIDMLNKNAKIHQNKYTFKYMNDINNSTCIKGDRT